MSPWNPVRYTRKSQTILKQKRQEKWIHLFLFNPTKTYETGREGVQDDKIKILLSYTQHVNGEPS